MSKKKSNQVSAISEQTPAISDETQVEKVEYMIGAWKGLPHFVCAECGFDAFFEVVMLNHLIDKHNSEVALARLEELEKDKPKPPAPSVIRTSSPNRESADLGEESVKDVFEVELVEIGSTVDAQGNEHKNFVIKE